MSCSGVEKPSYSMDVVVGAGNKKVNRTPFLRFPKNGHILLFVNFGGKPGNRAPKTFHSDSLVPKTHISSCSFRFLFSVLLSRRATRESALGKHCQVTWTCTFVGDLLSLSPNCWLVTGDSVFVGWHWQTWMLAVVSACLTKMEQPPKKVTSPDLPLRPGVRIRAWLFFDAARA